VFLVEQSEPPDITQAVLVIVVIIGAVQVQAPEAQALLDTVEGGELVCVHRGSGVALAARLGGVGVGCSQDLGESPHGIAAAFIEMLVEQGEVVLLGRQYVGRCCGNRHAMQSTFCASTGEPGTRTSGRLRTFQDINRLPRRLRAWRVQWW
jgi:hypothetical protein